jgi:hypothetical protein
VKWVEVVEAVVGAEVAPGAAADAARGGWVAPRPRGQAATAFAPTVDTRSRMWQASPVTRRSARSAARR